MKTLSTVFTTNGALPERFNKDLETDLNDALHDFSLVVNTSAFLDGFEEAKKEIESLNHKIISIFIYAIVSPNEVKNYLKEVCPDFITYNSEIFS